MRNYQLRKTNNQLTLKKWGFLFLFLKIISGGGGELGLYMYVYKPFFSRFWFYFTNFPEF